MIIAHSMSTSSVRQTAICNIEFLSAAEACDGFKMFLKSKNLIMNYK